MSTHIQPEATMAFARGKWQLGLAVLSAVTCLKSASATDWVRIGDPGNRGVNVEEVPLRPFWADVQLGAVHHEYRMATTEVTVAEWYDFVNAYSTYHTGAPNDGAFVGDGIVFVAGAYTLVGNPNAPTRMSWEFAARYCNWLHNGKALTPDAFESGAYDTGTFTVDDNGNANHQVTHTPGALFWIPSLNEWTKATYWDPNKNGNSIGGYWQYPGASDAPLVPGQQTNASDLEAPNEVGTYPQTSAPWGLLDASGGVSEWTEGVAGPLGRFTRGAAQASGPNTFAQLDRLDSVAGGNLRLPIAGLRLASAIPTPSGGVLLAASGVLVLRRRCRCRVVCYQSW